MMPKDYWTTYGHNCLGCGHKHKSEKKAIKCANRHNQHCKIAPSRKERKVLAYRYIAKRYCYLPVDVSTSDEEWAELANRLWGNQ